MARQIAAFRTAIAAGMPRLGWKIGINDPAAQQRMGISGPLLGWLDGRRVTAVGQDYSPPAGAKPRFEAEIALVIGHDLAPNAGIGPARAAIVAVAPAFEFVDATKPLSPLDELLANDVLHDGVLFGAEFPLSAATALNRGLLPKVRLNGALHREAAPGRVPDDLGEVVVHVSRILGAAGEQLLAGDRIICGSYIDPFDLASGDLIEADYGPLGTLTVRVA